MDAARGCVVVRHPRALASLLDRWRKESHYAFVFQPGKGAAEEGHASDASPPTASRSASRPTRSRRFTSPSCTVCVQLHHNNRSERDDDDFNDDCVRRRKGTNRAGGRGASCAMC